MAGLVNLVCPFGRNLLQINAAKKRVVINLDKSNINTSAAMPSKALTIINHTKHSFAGTCDDQATVTINGTVHTITLH